MDIATARELAAPFARIGLERVKPASRRLPAETRSAEDTIIHAAMVILLGRLKAREVFSSPDAVKQYLAMRLSSEQCEEFGVMFLDAQNRLIEMEVMFRGTLTQTSVYPREIVRRSLELGAASVVLAHNHPSGTVQPSRADEFLTTTVKAALSLVDVRVLDHVIVATGGQSLSMAERGLL